MSFPDYLFLFAGMGLVTYLPRWLPLFFLARRDLPKWLVEWLSLIPVAILCSLLAPILFTDQASRSLEIGKPEFLVAIPTLLFAVKTKSLGGTVLIGMGLYWISGFLLS
ncbi:putative membrane protein [Desulfocapsa sulfexigens DSM 10523]|uniref:Putative membrane protein n=1 Tax=Desulfocapsa sulfexigens (strain DSM 10523 / SB164P1) TaxID=1167006 RepID=M1PEZ6_DESSD|nr:AzlD domain-containing protein [Desulfocapsa sulfexigens]AGF78275.1 putative membrane protein [Desulfocapsa sulfexigens DSM 10523]